MDYETWANFGDDDGLCREGCTYRCGNSCDCDKCNGEPEDDSDIEINDKPREGVRENWTGA